MIIIYQDEVMSVEAFKHKMFMQQMIFGEYAYNPFDLKIILVK